MSSTAGVLLDEFPATMRERVAAELRSRDDAFWEALARHQVYLTYNRLHFRPFFYDFQKGQLPLPPADVWQIRLDGRPYRETISGHDLLLQDYTFTSTLLTDQASPAAAETALQEIGGRWQEPFVLPADPLLLLQRTGNACLNEGGFPPNSYDSENVYLFYDYTCTAGSGGAAGCHRTTLPALSCREALDGRVGAITTTLNFERLPWDETLAAAVRRGQVLSQEAPDLQVMTGDLQNNHIIYRYFPADSCALVEQCVDGSGWRRLLMFDANTHNLGGTALEIGKVVAENPLNNMFQYNACHDHYHFANYGEFQLGLADQPSKQAFCVESTSRFSNNEASPLTHDFSCRNQGIQAGWGDEYKAGLDCQWIDITDLALDDGPMTWPLTFRFNQDGFLCEGQPMLNEDGELIWEPSGQRTAEGLPISRPRCEFVENWDTNNEGSVDVSIVPAGSFVTAPCTQGELGPLRNCGFTAQALPPLPTPLPADNGETQPAFRCTPGQPVQLSCTLPANSPPQVLRICEVSAVLGVGTACTFETALATHTVTDDGRDPTFTCPLPRDAREPGGDYAFYTAPLFPEDAAAVVSCTAVQE